MAESKFKKLRDFIKSHEMRYFITEGYNCIFIKRAYKVKINNEDVWVHFEYGTGVVIKDERDLLKTMDVALAKKKKIREVYEKTKKKKEAKFAEVTDYLRNFGWYDLIDYHKNEVKPKGQPFADAIKRVYNGIPSKERDDERTYIGLLERYIQTGTIYSQALSFRSEHVVSVKYSGGEPGVVKIELTNGTTIIPKSEAVTRLIKTIFGSRLDSWSYNDIHEPSDKFDKINRIQ